jgi:hypothetical protein
MKHIELHRFKRVIGKITFGIFFPNENKRLEQKDGVGKQYDLVLVFVPTGKQTATRDYLITLTGWTQKKATDFIKEGHFPKVAIYNISPAVRITANALIPTMASVDGVIMEIY